MDMNDFNVMASQNNFQFDPHLFGDYREPQDNILGTGGFDETYFNDAFDTDFITPYNVAPTAPTQKKDLVAQIDAANEGDDSTETIAADGQLLTCNKVWYAVSPLPGHHKTDTDKHCREHLQNCTKVQEGDFDLDGLCADLQKKAKCSGSGAVVDEKDFKSVIQKYLGKTDKEMEEGCPDGLFGNANPIVSKTEPSPTST